MRVARCRGFERNMGNKSGKATYGLIDGYTLWRIYTEQQFDIG